VAARRSWATWGLSSGRFAVVGTVFLHCTGWYDKNNHSTGLRSVREAPLCLIYIRISLRTVSFEQKGGEPRTVIWSINIYVNLTVLAGIGRYFMK
jgi:hypothetical protein